MSILYSPWTSQPQQSVGIDWGNPINLGLAQVWIPGSAISPSGVAATNYGSPAYGRYGVAGKGNGSSTFAFLNGSTRAVDAYGSATTTDGAVTFLAAVKVGALASQQHFMNTCDGSGNAMGFRTNTTSIGLSQASGGSILNFTSAVTAGESCTVCVSGRNGSTDFFKNGRFVSNSSVSYGNTIADGVPVIGRGGTGTQYGDHEIYLLLAFNRRLSKAEGESLTANPWQIFKPIPRRIFVPVAAATGDGTGTGSLYAVTLSSPSATASGTANATASGQFSTIALTAPNGSASAGTSATASGSLSAVSTAAPSANASCSALATGALTAVGLATVAASATGTALATGSLSTVTLSTVSGTATGTTAGSAVGTGAIDSIQIDAPTAIAIASSVATGGFQSIGLTAPIGTASAVDSQSGTAIAALQYIYLVAPTGTASDGTYANAPIGAGPTVISSRQSRPSQSSMSRPSVKSGGRF